MNPTSDEQLPPPPQPPQPHRSSTAGYCDRHPDEQFTGFCPSCLCERLAVLDKSSSATVSSGRKSASSAIKSLFKPSSSSNNNNDGGGFGGGPALRGRASSSSFLPELRRTKSFSGGKNEGFLGFSGVFEPQRKSCDVRGRSTLFSLFSQDDEKRVGSHPHRRPSVVVVDNDTVSSGSNVVIESKREEESRDHGVLEEEEEEEEVEFHDSNDNRGEIQVVEGEEEEEIVAATATISGPQIVGEIEEEEEEEEQQKVGVVDLKTMKDHIDLDSQNKKAAAKDFKELAGSFWSAASVFSKKLRAWTKKHNNNNNGHSHKMKKHNGSHTVQVSGKKKGNAGRNFNINRDTQSEIADYGYGRRSCDTDPRLSFDVGRFSVDAGRYSVDAGRISFDDPRGSFDEPRASWDGYLIGRTFPRMVPPPPMVSVVEDAPAPPVVVARKDAQIPVEEPRRSSVSINGDEYLPGGATQTKDYYSDSSSRRRKSLDRSSSIRKTAAAVVAEMDEMKNLNVNVNNNNSSSANNGCNAKISPASIVGGERDLRDLRDLNSNSNSLRDDCSGSFDLGFRDSASVIGSGERKESSKKSRRWRAWNIWGLIYRRGNAKDEDEDRYSSVRANGVERSLSESWQELRRDGYGGDPRGGFNRNVLRSNSSVSWRNSYNMGGSFGSSIRKGSNSVEANGGGGGRKKKDEFVLERNRSARYSPNHADSNNGMLRFYLTPMRGSRRGGSGKPKPAYSHSFARSVLRLY